MPNTDARLERLIQQTTEIQVSHHEGELGYRDAVRRLKALGFKSREALELLKKTSP